MCFFRVTEGIMFMLRLKLCVLWMLWHEKKSLIMLRD